MLRKKFESSPYPKNEEYEELSCYLNTGTKEIRRCLSGERQQIKRKGQHSHQSKPCLSDTRQQLGQKQMSHTHIKCIYFFHNQNMCWVSEFGIMKAFVNVFLILSVR